MEGAKVAPARGESSTGFQQLDEDVPVVEIGHDQGRADSRSYQRSFSPEFHHERAEAGLSRSASFSLRDIFADENPTQQMSKNVKMAELLVGVVANMHEFSDPDDHENSSIFESFFDLTRPRLIAIFQMFDDMSVDKEKGILSYENFRAGLRDAGLDIKDKESFMRLAKRVDLDRDEGITFSEFETVVQSLKMAHMFQQIQENTKWENYLRVENYNVRRADFSVVRNMDFKSFMYEPRPSWATHRWIEVFLPAALTLKCLAIKHRLHPLALEDVLKDTRKARAKVDRFDNHMFVVFPVLALEYKYTSDEDEKNRGHRTKAFVRLPSTDAKSKQRALQSNVASGGYGSLGASMREPLIRGKKYSASSTGTYEEISARGQAYADQLDNNQVVVGTDGMASLVVPNVRKMNAYIFVTQPDRKTTICAVDQDCRNLFSRVHRELNVSYSRLRQKDAMYLLYTLIDVISDSYQPLVAELETILKQLQSFVRNSKRDTLSGKSEKYFMNAYHDMIREANNLRRWIVPAQRVVANLIQDELLEKDCKLYLQDVRDHLEQTVDDINSLLEGLRAIKEEHDHSLNLKMNSTMHLLTIVTAVALPSQLLSSIYGTNFDHNMYPVKEAWGFPVFWVVMVMSWFGLYYYFKYSGSL